MVRSLGEMGVDRVLSDGRKDLIAMATRRAQAGLDACHSGLELSSLELTRLAPPPSSDRLSSTRCRARSSALKHGAKRHRPSPTRPFRRRRRRPIPCCNRREASAESDLAAARGAADAFRALDREYRANAVVVRERLYRDGVEIALRSAGRVRWIPPPVGGRYNDFRVSIPSGGQTTPVIVEDEDEK